MSCYSIFASGSLPGWVVGTDHRRALIAEGGGVPTMMRSDHARLVKIRREQGRVSVRYSVAQNNYNLSFRRQGEPLGVETNSASKFTNQRSHVSRIEDHAHTPRYKRTRGRGRFLYSDETQHIVPVYPVIVIVRRVRTSSVLSVCQ